MKRDLYEEWINQETLEKGFKSSLWATVLEESAGDEIAAKMRYLERRKAQLIQENFVPPIFEEGVGLTRVPRRASPPGDFVDQNPKIVRFLGFILSLGLILFGFWMMRRFGLH